MDSRIKDPLAMTPEERLDALAEVLAEGILHLAENDEQLSRLAAEKRADCGAEAVEADGSLRNIA